MVHVNGVSYAIYYLNGKQRRVKLNGGTKAERDAAFSKLVKAGATIKVGSTIKEKLSNKPDLYIYERIPYFFKFKKKVLFESWDKDEVRKFRDRYFKTHKQP